jgi:TonB family protein
MRYAVCALIVGLLAGLPAGAQTPLDVTDPSITQKPQIAPNSPTPEYPYNALRAAHEGESKYSLCINTSGRVTSHKLMKSSGHEALDRATENWFRVARFKPAEISGVATAVCNYPLGYVWRLDAATRTANYLQIQHLPVQDRPRLLATAPEPEYPAKALADRAEGKVKVSLCIDAAGKVQTIALLTPGMHDALELATGRWATAGTYAPGRKNGSAVSVCGFEVEREWKLSQ